MLHIRRIDPRELLSGARYISIVGAGGKTTISEYLGRVAASDGRSTAVTTTTKIYAVEPYTLVGDMLSLPSSTKETGCGFIRIGKDRQGEKLTALSFDEVRQLGDLFDVVLIEADGAKRYPLKYPAEHEPVIPPFSDRILVVAGLDALHRVVGDSVFRWELACQQTGISREEEITPDLLSRFFSSSILLKGVEMSKCTIILNKYDALRERHEAVETASKILDKAGAEKVIISSPIHRLFYQLTEDRGFPACSRGLNGPS